jgi:RNA polymerase sigma-70 factor (ECF subfamily)
MADKRDHFWELLEPEHAKIRAFCRRLAGDHDDGDDLCQGALMQAYQRFESLRDPESFRPWLYRIAVNRYHNGRQRSFWRRLVRLEAAPESDPGFDPTGAYQAGRLLERAFKGVSPADRALVLLFETEGWTAAELGVLAGKSEAATRVRLCRIRSRMRNTLARHAAKIVKEHKAVIAREERLCIVTKPSAD